MTSIEKLKLTFQIIYNTYCMIISMTIYIKIIFIDLLYLLNYYLCSKLPY